MATMNLNEAKVRHEIVNLACDEFAQRGEGDSGHSVWNAITGRDPDASDTPWADAVRVTMPLDAVPVVRASNGIAASYAFALCCAYCPPPGSSLLDYELRELATKAWEKFEQRRGAACKVAEGFGWDLSPSWEAIREIDNLDSVDAKKVLAVAELAGRMSKALQVDAAKVVTNDPHEVRDVETGGVIERLLPVELASLFTPGLEDQAAIKILEKNAQQYRMKGESTASRGPLVIVLDESGSMHDDPQVAQGKYGRNTWAKACAVALTRVAHAGNRAVKIVHFGTATAVTDCPVGDHAAVLAASKHWLGGGTKIGRALQVALRCVGDLAAEGHYGADIVLVTDGEDGDYATQDAVLNEAQRRGVRLWTVAIEMPLVGKQPINWRAEKVIRVGESLEADLVGALREAAENTVSADELKKELN